MELRNAKVFECSWCGGKRDKITIWKNKKTGREISLCFLGCQNFPEPFRATGDGNFENWERVDPWQYYKKEFPKLRSTYGSVEVSVEKVRRQTLEKWVPDQVAVRKERGAGMSMSWEKAVEEIARRSGAKITRTQKTLIEL